MELIKNLRTTK